MREKHLRNLRKSAEQNPSQIRVKLILLSERERENKQLHGESEGKKWCKNRGEDSKRNYFANFELAKKKRKKEKESVSGEEFCEVKEKKARNRKQK